MTDAKKVEFIERVSKSVLELDGLQIVVYSDKNRDNNLSEEKMKEISFASIGKKMLSEIDGIYIKNKYNIESGIEFGNKLHEERIKWINTKV